MTVDMWKYYSGQLDVSTQVKLTFPHICFWYLYIYQQCYLVELKSEEMLTVVVMAVL